MQVQTHCQCGARYAFSEEQVGQQFRCSVCHQVFNVPPPGQKPIIMASKGPPPPAQLAPQPKSQRSTSGGMTCLLLAACFFVVLVVGGLMMVWLLASSASTAISNSISSMDGMVKMAAQLEHLSNPEKVISKYTDQGYEQVIAQITKDSKPITKKTLFTCQVLDLTSDSSADLAILSQSATLRGEIQGNVDFYGQSLVIEEDAVITGDLNLGFAQLVQVKGKVGGKLTGGYQMLKGEQNIQGGVDSSGGLMDLIRNGVDSQNDSTDSAEVNSESDSAEVNSESDSETSPKK